MIKTILRFAVFLFMFGSLHAQQREASFFYYYFKGADTLHAEPVALNSADDAEDKLDVIASMLTEKFFSRYFDLYSETNIKIEIEKVKCIKTSDYTFKIAVINIYDPELICMKTYFQGSTGGRNTFVMLGTNLMQPQIAPPFIDGLIILYNNKPAPELDHINLQRILNRDDFYYWSHKALGK